MLPSVPTIFILICSILNKVQSQSAASGVIQKLYLHRATESGITLRWALTEDVYDQNVTFKKYTMSETTRCEHVHMPPADAREHVISGLSSDTRFRVCLEARPEASAEVQLRCEFMSTSKRIHKSSAVALVIALLVLGLLIVTGILAWHCAKRREARACKEEEDREPLNHCGIEEKA